MNTLSGKSNPLVSVIMNCRNAQEYLKEAIESVYAQSYPYWEIIFWDNASTDSSADIAKSYSTKLRYYRNTQYSALGSARNQALQEARGEYIAFLDCDDQWLPQKLLKQVNLMQELSEINFIYSNYFRLIMPQTNSPVLALKGHQPEGDVFKSFLYNYPVNLQTVMLRTSAIYESGVKFDDTLEVSEEFDFFMRILFTSKALYINEPLAIYRLHQNMSSQKLIHKYPDEMSYVLNKLKNLNGFIKQKYIKEIKYYEAKIGYSHARAAMEQNNPKLARTKLNPYKFTDIKFFILYTLTLFSPVLWKWFQDRKAENKFSWIK